jgi:membrane-bound lytic murein transglycosylase F
METLITVASLFGVAWAALATVYLALVAFDRWVYPGLSFEQELRRNNIAVAIFLAALAFGIFFLMSHAVAADLDRYDDQFRLWGRHHFGYAVDWRWFKAQGVTESGLEPGACSPAGACGLMQFLPGTALAMGLRNRFEARESIRAGIAYDRRLWEAFHPPRPSADRLAFAFSAYNWGVGNVVRRGLPCARARSGGDRLWEQLRPCLPPETQAYYPRIARWRQRFAGPAARLAGGSLGA